MARPLVMREIHSMEQIGTVLKRLIQGLCEDCSETCSSKPTGYEDRKKENSGGEPEHEKPTNRQKCKLNEF